MEAVQAARKFYSATISHKAVIPISPHPIGGHHLLRLLQRQLDRRKPGLSLRDGWGGLHDHLKSGWGHLDRGVLIGKVYGHLSREHPRQMANKLDAAF